MQEINRTDQTIATNPLVNVNIPPVGIDIRRILIAIRYEIPRRKLLFSANTRADVFIPTLYRKIIMIPYNNHIVIRQYKAIKIPIVMDGDLLDMRIVDIIAAWIENRGVNIKHELFSIHEYNDHSETLT